MVQAPRHEGARHHDRAPTRGGAPTVSEGRVLLSAVLLAGGVAAAVAAATVRLAADEGARIASVRLAELMAEHAEAAARSDASPEETAAATRAWAAALEESLDYLAMRGGLVLLPARAVAAGAPDLTDEVRFLLAEKGALERTEARP